jgi:hypothetical protein
MTAAPTLTRPTVSSPPPAPRRRRRGLLAIGLAVLVVIAALTAWLITINSSTMTDPKAPTSVAAPQAPAPGQAPAGSNQGSVEGPAAYVEFCQNSPTLCTPTAATQEVTGYIQFCHNSASLCAPPAAEPRDSGYAQFCQNNPALCTKPRAN